MQSQSPDVQEVQRNTVALHLTQMSSTTEPCADGLSTQHPAHRHREGCEEEREGGAQSLQPLLEKPGRQKEGKGLG